MQSLLRFLVKANAKAHKRALRNIARNKKALQNKALVHVTIYMGKG